MKNLVSFCKIMKASGTSSLTKLACFRETRSGFRVSLSRVNPFFWQLIYFVTFSVFGFLSLKVSKPRSGTKPKDLDLFFMSVSSTTVASMSTLEMEIFSNTQLIIITILMFLGGEVFLSFLGLRFQSSKLLKNSVARDENNSTDGFVSFNPKNTIDIEMAGLETQTQNLAINLKKLGDDHSNSDRLKSRSVEYLSYVVLGYLFVVHLGGSCLVFMYTSIVPSASPVLRNKGLCFQTFSLFTTVSTFANCGFIPTNENMIVFKNNSGLLLIIFPLILLGNTLYPPCLRFLIFVLEKATKKQEFGYILRNYSELGYDHLLSSSRSALLVATVFGFIFMQMILFCLMEWNSEVMDGLNSYQKVVAAFFQNVNTRHSGESVFDLSAISPAILVLFVVMMYLPPYTTYFPLKSIERDSRNGKECRSIKGKVVRLLNVSQLSYLTLFIILICISERERLKEDPVNFNLLSITLEVISAYGNVGFTTGYSCKRRVKSVGSCEDRWYGFVGRWSSKGKFILIVVMFFGRLKKFNLDGGVSWLLS